jgi:hypothetical protein
MAAQRRETREQHEAWLALESVLASAPPRSSMRTRAEALSDAVLLPAVHRCLRVLCE